MQIIYTTCEHQSLQQAWTSMCRWQLTGWNWATTAARLIYQFFERLAVAPYDEWASRKERKSCEYFGVRKCQWKQSGTFEADRRGGESENDVRAAGKVKGWNEDVRMNSKEGGKWQKAVSHSLAAHFCIHNNVLSHAQTCSKKKKEMKKHFVMSCDGIKRQKLESFSSSVAENKPENTEEKPISNPASFNRLDSPRFTAQTAVKPTMQHRLHRLNVISNMCRLRETKGLRM